jgi:hypothetical protein
MDSREEMTDKALRSLDNEVATILKHVLLACPMALGPHVDANVEAKTYRSLLNGFLVGQNTMAPLTYKVLKDALDRILPGPPQLANGGDGGGGGGGDDGDGGGG